MKTKIKLLPNVAQRVEVVSRFLNVHEATAEFRINFGDGTPVYVDRADFLDFGEGSLKGRSVTFVNESDSDIDIELSFSPVKLYRVKRVELDQTVPVTIEGDLPLVSFDGVQPVSVAGAVNVQEVKPDRVMSFGAVEIASDGLPVALDLSGAYGFGFSPSQGAKWAGLDLSQGLTVAETSNKKMNASGQVEGVAGQVVNYWVVE